MACKLITFLGTGKYSEVEYFLDDGTEVVAHASRFVQASMASLFEPDSVLILLTDRARKENWLGTKSKIPLETVTRDLPNIPFHPISIPDGFNEKETWEIFSRLADHIDENDEIIFDVTHSFRSIPILALACLQYLRVLKHIEIKGIYYGCWEAKQDATPLPRAPIVNLTPFLDVMDWSTAVSSFVDKGDVADLGRLLRKETVPRLSGELRDRSKILEFRWNMG